MALIEYTKFTNPTPEEISLREECIAIANRLLSATPVLGAVPRGKGPSDVDALNKALKVRDNDVKNLEDALSGKQKNMELGPVFVFNKQKKNVSATAINFAIYHICLSYFTSKGNCVLHPLWPF